MPDSQGHISRKTVLRDSFGRDITYLRLSVTDRCDLRCTYCMAENMTFLPKAEVLSLEELLFLSQAFVARGIKRIRLTGGEPLVRKNIMWLFDRLGADVKSGQLEELTLTTNGTQLGLLAQPLYEAGVRRVNISLDTLDAAVFEKVSRRNQLQAVLNGIEAAKIAGLKVKINTVAMRGLNETEIPNLIQWILEEKIDLTLIETMPLGLVENNREDHFLPLSKVKEDLEQQFTLQESSKRTGGPARYFTVNGTEQKLGFITPLTNNFCAGCNRIRVTCTGRIYMCLGQDDHVDLRAALRGETPGESLSKCLDRAIGLKPKSHDFAMQDGKMIGQVSRHMSQTGG